MGLFKNHERLRPIEQQEEIIGKTPQIREEKDRSKLPETDSPFNLESEFDEGFNKEPKNVIDVEDIADEGAEDRMIASLDRRMDQSRKDKAAYKANLNKVSKN
ncbi:MAG TPA: hypothetical protein PKI61_00815 [bacterium]|nr:hypothetical protein [bacterium]HPT29426.1 hypothetical protein [bacterium]